MRHKAAGLPLACVFYFQSPPEASGRALGMSKVKAIFPQMLPIRRPATDHDEKKYGTRASVILANSRPPAPLGTKSGRIADATLDNGPR